MDNTCEYLEDDNEKEKGDFKKQLAEVEKLKIISLFDFIPTTIARFSSCLSWIF